MPAQVGVALSLHIRKSCATYKPYAVLRYVKKLCRILFKYFHSNLENSLCGKLQRVISESKKDNREENS
jgi:hypothetical protein